MRIISTTDLSREGNDCFILESISLIEQFNIYAVIKCFKINSSYSTIENFEVVFSSSNCGEAVEKYDRMGGKITRV